MNIVRNSPQSAAVALVAAALALAAFTTPASLGTCPPDTDCNGTVDVNDLLTVIGHWGGIGPDGDINGDGYVNVNDLLYVVQYWGPCLFAFGPQYPNAEAHQIGLEMLGPNGALTLNQAAYERIDRDLGLIRAAHAGLVDQEHSMAWLPTQLIVALFQGQSWAEYQCLNTYYQVTNIDPLFILGGVEYVVVTFAGKVNVEALMNIYTELPEVSFAEPNGLIGGQNYWEPTDLGNGLWQWHIDDGFHDCFDGCDCHREYLIQIDGPGNVTTISYSEWGLPWCDFGTK